jgi:hypothetical protein
VTHRVLAQIAALAKASLPDRKAQYKDLFGAEAPGINRAFLERRLAYKLQKLAYGGLSQPAVAQLEALAKTADKGSTPRTRMRAQGRRIAGTRLLRVWNGVEHSVTVLQTGFEYQGPAFHQLVGDCQAHHRHPVEWTGLLRPAREAVVTETVLKRRCAVYTRKSTDEGLDMVFNSLDVQREACEAYVASQRGEGWMLVADHYDDGGLSGGTLERPALKRLLADIQAGKIDCVVVYKNGTQPATLQLSDLEQPFPIDWGAQRTAFGFPARLGN